MKEIESAANNTIKLIKSLKMAKYRKETGLYIVEGERIVEEAIRYCTPKYIVCSKSYYATYKAREEKCNTIVVPDKIFDSLCDTKSPQGILSVMEISDEYPSINNGIIVALEGVQNPLNVGTIIRTADAFGAKGVILSPECADIYSPKVLRGTMGSIFHIPIIRSNKFYDDIEDYKNKGFSLIAGDLHGSEMQGFSGDAILAVGNEGSGITERLRKMCDILWKISMPGQAESLNASVAAGIMLYTLIS